MKKDSSPQLDTAALANSLKQFVGRAWAYRTFIFFLLMASFYGFILWRINAYSNTPASQSEETAQATTQPHIDKETIDKLQSLQDNSISVQAVFDQARENPFQ